MALIPSIIGSSLRHFSQKASLKALPHPKGLPLIGTMLDLMTAGGGPKLHLYIDTRHKQLGPIFAETLGPMSAVFISDPRDMRQVFAFEGKYPVHFLPDAWVLYNKLYGSERGLFFMEGEEWLKYRKIMNKVMMKSEPSPGLLNAYKTATNHLIDEWSKDINKPVTNAVHHMYKLSISYVIATLLGSSYPGHTELLRPSVEELCTIVHLIFEESTKLNLLPAKIAAALRLPVWRRFVSAVDTTLTKTNKLVTQLLPLAASDGVLYKMSAEGVPQDKIVSIVADLILAAADTTPYTMIWALYLLSRNPEVQTHVAREVIQSPPDQWLNDSLLRAVMRETLRLYPAAPFLTRCLTDDVELSGYTVPAGQMIVMSLYTSGRSDLNFPEALKFWPERWLRKDSKYIAVNESSASLPFAMGGRACIGRKVAEALLSITLAEILTQFKVEVEKEIEMVLMLVPVPAEPVTLHLSKREL